MHQAIGNRAGEGATWHRLATIDLNEGTTRQHGSSSERRSPCSKLSATAQARRPADSLATIDVREGNYAAARDSSERL